MTASGDVGSEKDTDLALFAQGYVTLTLLDGDLSVTPTASAGVTSRLTKLQLPKTAMQ